MNDDEVDQFYDWLNSVNIELIDESEDDDLEDDDYLSSELDDDDDETAQISEKAEDKKETIYEIADLAYHVMVLMIEAGISLEDIHKELASRHVIDKKVKQEKMTGDNQ